MLFVLLLEHRQRIQCALHDSVYRNSQVWQLSLKSVCLSFFLYADERDIEVQWMNLNPRIYQTRLSGGHTRGIETELVTLSVVMCLSGKIHC
jgi:hypothetical protein